jgi:hypothetical protein
MLAVTLVAISVMSYYFNNKYMLGKHKQTLKEKIQRKKKLREDIDSKPTYDLKGLTLDNIVANGDFSNDDERVENALNSYNKEERGKE